MADALLVEANGKELREKDNERNDASDDQRDDDKLRPTGAKSPVGITNANEENANNRGKDKAEKRNASQVDRRVAELCAHTFVQRRAEAANAQR
jgi:hypothetical protein